MNKYIISQLIMSLLISFHASAMESVQNKEDLSIAVGVCYLANLSLDIQNYIASFLMETEEEFIARTKMQKDVPSYHYEKFCLKALRKKLRRDKIKLVERKNSCTGVAFSRGRSLIGMIYRQRKLQKEFGCHDIEIVHIAAKSTLLIHRIGDMFFYKTIDFNKQGTSLIVHGKDYVTNENKHMMYSLKSVDPDKLQVKEGPNKLQNYFRDKFICNNRIEGQK